jgi:thiol-disulfide isomerase/thioredoxin
MDRLSSLIAAVFAAIPFSHAARANASRFALGRGCPVALVAALSVGCTSSSDSGKAKAGRSRVQAVEAEADPRFEPAQFCESWHGEGGPSFAFPPLASGEAPASDSARWVNVWATWCGPCVEEFPRITAWNQTLADNGHPTEVVFVSVDGPDVDLDAFAREHPQVAGSLKIADPEQLSTWLGELGLPEGSVLPIHLFVDAAGKLRCVRMGGVGVEDYPGVEAVVTAMSK